jgi:hypothetical protein
LFFLAISFPPLKRRAIFTRPACPGLAHISANQFKSAFISVELFGRPTPVASVMETFWTCRLFLGNATNWYARLTISATMKNLTDPTWIQAKGILFLLLGLLAGTLLLLEHPSLRIALLLVLTVWCFCRFYYFAFYVIQHYVDPNYKFSGLLSFASYLIRRQR